MQRKCTRIILAIFGFGLCILTVGAAVGGVIAYLPTEAPDSNASLRELVSQYAHVNISADYSALSTNDQHALMKIVGAIRLMNDIFLRQVYRNNVRLQTWLEEAQLVQYPEEKDHQRVQLQQQLFDINFGPWDRITGQRFIPMEETSQITVPLLRSIPSQQPPCANFYPQNMTREQFLNWIPELSPARQADAVSPYYVIRQLPDDDILVGVAYNIAYFPLLSDASNLLHQAANLTTFPSLQTYLHKIADALVQNQYNASDYAWLHLDRPIDVTMGM